MAARFQQLPASIQSNISKEEDKRLTILSEFGSRLSIYNLRSYKSASKIEHSQFLALHTVWIVVQREQFDSQLWGIKNVDKAEQQLHGTPSWEAFLENNIPQGEILPVPDLGGWSLIWYYIQVVQRLQLNLEAKDEPKITFPVSYRTSAKLRKERDREEPALDAQSPCSTRRGAPGPQPDFPSSLNLPSDWEFQSQYALTSDNGLTSEIDIPSDRPDIMMQEPAFDSEPMVSQSSESDPTYEEIIPFECLSGEPIVNTALIGLLNVLTYSVPGIKAHWSLQRKIFTFEEDGTKLYEARIDGHLFTARNPLASKIIVEV